MSRIAWYDKYIELHVMVVCAMCAVQEYNTRPELHSASLLLMMLHKLYTWLLARRIKVMKVHSMFIAVVKII